MYVSAQHLSLAEKRKEPTLQSDTCRLLEKVSRRDTYRLLDGKAVVVPLAWRAAEANEGSLQHAILSKELLAQRLSVSLCLESHRPVHNPPVRVDVAPRGVSAIRIFAQCHERGILAGRQGGNGSASACCDLIFDRLDLLLEKVRACEIPVQLLEALFLLSSLLADVVKHTGSSFSVDPWVEFRTIRADTTIVVLATVDALILALAEIVAIPVAGLANLAIDHVRVKQILEKKRGSGQSWRWRWVAGA
jgi:hypothetical protein